MSEASLELWEQLVALHQALDEAQIPHAFGGALALAYCARPRSTDDIDVNVAVAPAELDRVLAALPAGVELTGKETTLAARDGQLRLWWGRTAIDIFFVQHPFHDDIARHARIVPFADIEIPVISGEHLVVCKAMFDRTKDWQDIDAIAHAGTTDLTEALRWLTELLGSHAPQVAHLQAVAGEANRPQGPAPAPGEAETRTRVNAIFQRPAVPDTTKNPHP